MPMKVRGIIRDDVEIEPEQVTDAEWLEAATSELGSLALAHNAHYRRTSLEILAVVAAWGGRELRERIAAMRAALDDFEGDPRWWIGLAPCRAMMEDAPEPDDEDDDEEETVEVPTALLRHLRDQWEEGDIAEPVRHLLAYLEDAEEAAE